MLSHHRVWSAIDALAARYGHTPSGLARLAGLDPTAFNKSKRAAPDGRPRWPSTESLAKVLAATGATLEEFVALVNARGAPRRHLIPVIGLAQAGRNGFFDDAGFPVGAGWDEVAFPGLEDPHAYALEISGDSMEPLMREGDIVIVSPAASVRRGDRVVVKTTGGEVTAKTLARQTARRVELASLNPAYEPRVLDLAEIAFMHRIVWVSQ